jgi:hypothetical protein
MNRTANHPITEQFEQDPDQYRTSTTPGWLPEPPRMTIV